MVNSSDRIRGAAAVTTLASRRMRGAVIGRIVGVGDRGLPLVDFDGNDQAALAARYVMSGLAESLDSLAERRQEVLLNFENEEVSRPIIVGLLQPIGSAEKRSPGEGSDPALQEFIVVEGKRIRIEGRDEVVISCGEASITLRRNGKVITRGTLLDSESLGANWIRGADIQVG